METVEKHILDFGKYDISFLHPLYCVLGQTPLISNDGGPDLFHDIFKFKALGRHINSSAEMYHDLNNSSIIKFNLL